MLKLKKFSIIGMVIVLLIVGMLIPTKVEASEITPFAYVDPAPISFRGSYTGSSYYYDGNYLSFEATATASDGVSREIIISVYIFNTNTTKRFVTYSDGVRRRADNIPINGGSAVVISASCSDSSVTINLDLQMSSGN